VTNRYKVWVRRDGGGMGSILLRTGTPREAPDFDSIHDIGDFIGSPAEVAAKALAHAGAYSFAHSHADVHAVLVKDFDTGRCCTVVVTVSEGWI